MNWSKPYNGDKPNRVFSLLQSRKLFHDISSMLCFAMLNDQTGLVL